MPLVCLGLSHRTAPAEVRERHTFPPAKAAEALVALRDYEAVREAAMLSTCGRLELYAEVDAPERGIAQLKQFLLNFRHGNIAYDIEPYLYTHVDGDAVAQLMRVATGLDSMLLGEVEILGQVKAAYNLAQRAGSLGPALHRLFREALNAGKASRSETAIGGSSVSIATAAVAAARERVGSLRGATVVVIGAGKMGQTAALRLKHEGAELIVLNRTHERARSLVTGLGVGRALDLQALGAALERADVIITSTGASEFVLTVDNVGEAMRRRPDRPLCIIDIAVPRDVEPAVARIAEVSVTDVDQLGAAIDLTLEHRRRAIPFVEHIVEVRRRRFEAWYRIRAATPVIASLAKRADKLRDAELARLFARCPELTERERSLITGMSLTLLSKLLHPAFTGIREAAAEDMDVLPATIVGRLFELDLTAPAQRLEPALDVKAPSARSARVETSRRR